MQTLIVDYGMSNIGSIRRALEECGDGALVSANPADLGKVNRIVLPGVGSFRDGMKNLKEGGWVEALREYTGERGYLLLGICLGMQLLAETGFEGGETKGLGLIPGKVEKMKPKKKSERLPHVGWNDVNQMQENSLFAGIKDGADFYFVHSYSFIPSEEKDVLAKTNYCGGFVSAISHGKVFGVQFHPEKSSTSGFQLLKNFLAI